MKKPTKEPTDGLRNRPLIDRLGPFLSCANLSGSITWGEYRATWDAVCELEKRPKKTANNREKGV